MTNSKLEVRTRSRLKKAELQGNSQLNQSAQQERNAVQYVKVEIHVDPQFRRLPGQLLDDTQRQLNELLQSLLQIKGDQEHFLDSACKPSYLTDQDALMEAVRCGALGSEVLDSMVLSFQTSRLLDIACYYFLSALKSYAWALVYEDHNQNIMWCALVSAHGNIAHCNSHLGYLENKDRSQRHPSAPASPAQAGAMGGEQHGRNHLLVRTHLALLLYQKRPENGWKDSMQAARALQEPLQRFIDDNRIETLGAGEAKSLETKIINWLDDTKDGHKDVRTAFKATQCKPSA